MCFSVGSMGLSIRPSFVIVLFLISTDAYLDGLGLGKWLVVYPVILSETHIPCRTVFQRPYIYKPGPVHEPTEPIQESLFEALNRNPWKNPLNSEVWYLRALSPRHFQGKASWTQVC